MTYEIVQPNVFRVEHAHHVHFFFPYCLTKLPNCLPTPGPVPRPLDFCFAPIRAVARWYSNETFALARLDGLNAVHNSVVDSEI